MWSQVGFRKHYYEQSKWRWWNSSWAISNPKRWCCQSAALNTPQNLENSAVATVFIPIPKKGNAKECSNYCTIALLSHASKEMLKILQARLQQYVNCELSNVQTGFRKGRGKWKWTHSVVSNSLWPPWTVAHQAPPSMGFSRQWKLTPVFLPGEKAEEPEIKLPTSAGPLKRQGSSRKRFSSALLTMPKPLTAWITINYGKFWKRWEYQTTWPASWEICMQVRK